MLPKWFIPSFILQRETFLFSKWSNYLMLANFFGFSTPVEWSKIIFRLLMVLMLRLLLLSFKWRFWRSLLFIALLLGLLQLLNLASVLYCLSWAICPYFWNLSTNLASITLHISLSKLFHSFKCVVKSVLPNLSKVALIFFYLTTNECQT